MDRNQDILCDTLTPSSDEIERGATNSSEDRDLFYQKEETTHIAHNPNTDEFMSPLNQLDNLPFKHSDFIKTAEHSANSLLVDISKPIGGMPTSTLLGNLNREFDALDVLNSRVESHDDFSWRAEAVNNSSVTVPSSIRTFSHPDTLSEVCNEKLIDSPQSDYDVLEKTMVEKKPEEDFMKRHFDVMTSSPHNSPCDENKDKLVDVDNSSHKHTVPFPATSHVPSEGSLMINPFEQNIEKSSISLLMKDDILVPIDVSKSNIKKKDVCGFGDATCVSENTLEPKIPPNNSEVTFSDIGPNNFFSTFGLDMWFHPERLNPAVEAYIYWRDPKLSGIVFGSGLILLLSLTYFSFISVVANAGLGVLICAIIFRLYKDILQAVQKNSQTHLYSGFVSQDIRLPQEKVHEIVDAIIVHVNACLGEIRRLFLVEDMIESLKLALILWVLTYIGSWFNGLTLVIIGFVSLFTLPKVYENNKTQIDQNLTLVRAKLEELKGKMKDALPAPLRRKLPGKKE